MNIRETIEHKNHTIKIIQDEDPRDPRESDNIATMRCSHKDYKLGDIQGENGDEGFLDHLVNTFDIIDISKDYTDEEREETTQKRMIDNLYFLPLYLYDHSGITISTAPFTCSWDSGQIGRVYIEKAKATTEGINKDQAMETMKGEVKTYDDYLTGSVCGYVIEGEKSDSCRGFYSTEDAIAEAKSMIG